jgi:hydantoinase/carbamoylase family amidase
LPDGARIEARLEALWRIALGPGGGADRAAFSPAEATATRLVAGWAREAGLEPGLDEHGNLWAVPPDFSGPLVTSGSHVDTVPDGGRYDGALGTVLALELADELRAGTSGGARPALLVCVAEEAPRFGAGTIGSRLLVGSLSKRDLDRLSDANATSAATAHAQYMEQLADLPVTQPPLRRIRAHVEVHVAQRRALHMLGVVKRVAAPRRLQIVLAGEAGHAGEVSMEDRRDALAAAAEIVLTIEHAAREEPAETVATVGTLTVEPGALSVIPATVRLGLDMRAIDAGSLDRLDGAIRGAITGIAARREVRADIRRLRGGEPVALDEGLVGAALDAAGRRAIAATPTWSGAGHDAQHLAAVIPTLLLFVPLRGGESHTPLEDAAPADIADATLVAGDVLAAI